MQHANSQFQHVGSNSLTRDRTWASCTGSMESYTTGRPRKPLPCHSYLPSSLSPSHSQHSGYTGLDNSNSFFFRTFFLVHLLEALPPRYSHSSFQLCIYTKITSLKTSSLNPLEKVAISSHLLIFLFPYFTFP